MTTPTRIPFTLIEWQSGLYDVVTRDGKTTISDLKINDINTAADFGIWVVRSSSMNSTWTDRGRNGLWAECNLDLFLVPKPTTADEGREETIAECSCHEALTMPCPIHSKQPLKFDPPCALCGKEKGEHKEPWGFDVWPKAAQDSYHEYTPQTQKEVTGPIYGLVEGWVIMSIKSQP